MKKRGGEEAHPWLEHEKFAECRTMTGHRWQRRGKYELDGREAHVEQVCQGCTSVRHRWWDIWSGKITASWIDHANGYLAVNVGRPMTQADARLLFTQKLFPNVRKTAATQAVPVRRRRRGKAA